jgi:3-dehydroquinate synthase
MWQTFNFSKSKTHFLFNGKFNDAIKLVNKKDVVFITDENVFNAHQIKFKNQNCIVIKAGEAFKIQQTVDAIIDQLIEFKANRQTTLIGVGGGVVTDITGYVASIYMRGVAFGFIPTTILGLVDASIGGKNGIDVGVYKNMVGNINQPNFILHDYSLLQSLPIKEWQNGFAEIIKHACIKDAAMFNTLQQHDIDFFIKNKKATAQLIHANAAIKIKVVQKDEFEKGDRKLLNFGHTLGHALENQYELSHGEAISIGMTYACELSHQELGFKHTQQVVNTLAQYQLPTYASFNAKKAMKILQHDKKSEEDAVNYILLQKIGKGVIRKIEFAKLLDFLSK